METKEENTIRRGVWRANNREQDNETAREYRKRNQARINKRMRARLANDPVYAEKVRARDRARWENRKESKRDYDLQTKYGITLDDYNQMLEKQGGGCAICKRKDADSLKRPLVVDHCHDEGHVRGLLCGHCNMGIGQFSHDISLLTKAIGYLEAT